MELRFITEFNVLQKNLIEMARAVTNGKLLSTLHIFYNSVMQNQLKKPR